jgi:hypothetical protein
MLHVHKFFSPGPKEASGATIKSDDFNEDDATVNTDQTDETVDEDINDFDELEELDGLEDSEEDPEEKPNSIF